MKGFLKGEFFKLIKFGLTGVMNTVVDVVVFMALGALGMPVYPSQVISYGCGMLNSYIVNRSWTFKSKGSFLGPQMLRFFAANILLLLFSLVLLWLFTTKYGMIKIAAKLTSTVIIMAMGFAVNRMWVFKSR